MNEFRIYLRAIEPEDYLVSYQWRNDHKLMKGVVDMPRFISKETERKWVLKAIEENETGRALRLAICTKEGNKLIGHISLLEIDDHNKTCCVGSLIGDKDYHGKGIMGEARQLIFRYAFSELGMNRISATILADNVASIKAVEKFGYAREGILRQAVFRNGEYRDVVMYSMLKSEFITRYPQDETTGLC